ncbi:polysaccharide pyruvyl transferase family protein [Seonamhaeicola maritimus]|uniref:Polysaccharide pyruvyl transferase family protein n=1 Tax=Seonamhaeicola maritimus TaxID=2591822 RepID=A0A5C7GL63_9FLAO|nr:polysaccharide pyruvyl transferase family protein [Seonamhaeicola maritimus]TXG38867.1 polysaccharide pyruvyl transferase family protein [Seonamhaeicola maritimus]
MALRTYYWNRLKVSQYRYYKHRLWNPAKEVFKHGNSGDIFNEYLIRYLYGNQLVENVRTKGDKLLLVGSTLSVIEYGDIVNGIGWKGNDLSNKQDIIASAKVFGVRGPLTRLLFEKYGADLSNLKFELDPGLLIKEVCNLKIADNTNKNVIFIPHFRDFWIYKGNYPRGLKVVNIDNKPEKIGKEIQKAKIVYTSSLHGIIFAHALNKECVFVKPQSSEPIFKYKDYFLSVGIDYPDPLENVFSIDFIKDKSTVLSKTIGLKDFYFPDVEFLKKSRVLT